jgi:phosphatidylglycerophosphate synthase
MKQETPRLAACILGESGVAPFGLGGRARLSRQLARLDIEETDCAERADMLISAGCLYGASVLSGLAEAARGTLLADNRGRACAARMPVEPSMISAVADGRVAIADRATTGTAIAGRYDAKLRKRADAMVLRLEDRAAAERALFGAAYKGVTDFVTKHVWPVPALAVTRWCARLGISPNQVTWASAVLVALAFWLFWRGDFALGLAAAWAMTFLDTVDGKLARVTLTSSRLGDVLDHGIDLIHPPFWWWAWAVGCAAIGQPLADGGVTLGVIVAGYVLQRVEEGLFLARYGMEMHVWRRFDSLFRQVTARRNPNLLILTAAAIIGAPREGLITVAVWTVACLFIHAARVVQAELEARRGRLTSWLAEG